MIGLEPTLQSATSCCLLPGRSRSLTPPSMAAFPRNAPSSRFSALPRVVGSILYF